MQAAITGWNEGPVAGIMVGEHRPIGARPVVAIMMSGEVLAVSHLPAGASPAEEGCGTYNDEDAGAIHIRGLLDDRQFPIHTNLRREDRANGEKDRAEAWAEGAKTDLFRDRTTLLASPVSTIEPD
jgi:hypothetical protein